MSIRSRAFALAALVALLGASPARPAPARDGTHDFDFKVGTWTTEIRRLRTPLAGADDWISLEGRVVARPVWDGKAVVEEIDARATAQDAGAVRFEGLTLFLYDPATARWSLYFSNVRTGRIDTPAVGAFENGRGVFYDSELVDGRPVLVRIVWSDITRDGHRFEQSFSADGGATWEANFVARLTRVPS